MQTGLLIDGLLIQNPFKPPQHPSRT